MHNPFPKCFLFLFYILLFHVITEIPGISFFVLYSYVYVYNSIQLFFHKVYFYDAYNVQLFVFGHCHIGVTKVKVMGGVGLD